jgi:hypothetical protein
LFSGRPLYTSTLPVVAESFALHEQPSLHLAIEDHIGRDGRHAEVFGIAGQEGYMEGGLADLVAPTGSFGRPIEEGPVVYANVALGDQKTLACIQSGLFLIRDGQGRVALFVRQQNQITRGEGFILEVMAPDRASAERILGDLRTAMRTRNVYRGHVVSLREEGFRDIRVEFHGLPTIERDAIILPDGLLKRIEMQTITFGQHSRRLREAGRHLKRGLLLHGPPGTGKTLTIMYLAGAMRDRTVFLMTGRNLGLVRRTCAMARALEPSIVVLEDVDLIAEERTRSGNGCATPLLFELLNEMDGLADDADVLFLLTTNRPDLLEPALSARPGRIDHAIEIPLPDDACRRRLLDLYGKGLTLRISDMGRLVKRTDGASAAFIRELLRRAALFAADEGGELVVEDRHVDGALHDLIVRGGKLNESLLGYRSRIGFGFEERG